MRHLIITTIILLTAACAGAPMPKRGDDVGLRVSVGVGQARISGEDTESEEKAHGTGSAYGLRVELNQRPKDFPNLVVGLRVGLGLQDSKADGFGENGNGELELQAQSYELEGVIRGYVPVTAWLRPFGEVHGGFGYHTGDLTASGGGLPEQIRGRDGDFAPVGGAALGVELDVSDKASIFLQGDYSVRLSELEKLKFRSEDVMMFLGGEFRF